MKSHSFCFHHLYHYRVLALLVLRLDCDLGGISGWMGKIGVKFLEMVMSPLQWVSQEPDLSLFAFLSGNNKKSNIKTK